MTSPALVRVAVDSQIATLTLNRPEARNALSAELCNAIETALVEIDDDPSVRVVLMQGEGPVFCSGADFAAVSGKGGLEFLPAFDSMLEALARFRLPVVAAIQGAALGGGLQLATACDFRVAGDNARIGIPSARLGIVVNFENVQRLVLLAGVGRAKEILMTGRVFSGAEAAAAGLVTQSVPEQQLTDAAGELCEVLATNAPLSVQGAKRSVVVVADELADGRRRSPEEVAEIDRLVAGAYNSADLQEGVRAMSEKRRPRFEGR